MSSELRELYQEVILDHNKRPRNFHKLEGANRSADGHNPLCGDRLSVYLTVENGIIKDISFIGKGCAISTASASMMTETLKGKTLAEAEKIFEGFHQLVTQESISTAAEKEEALGKLAVFSGVREFPVRVKCATLPWHTLHAALQNEHEIVTTE
jgi:nitrogen fixation NifU-like protein